VGTYTYTARDVAGIEVRGVLQADSQQDILTWLKDKSYMPLSIEAVTVPKGKAKGAWRLGIRSEDMASFCWQLNTMIDGGVTITDAIDTITDDIDNRRLQGVLRTVSEQMKTGVSFYESVRKYPKVFSPLFCAMIRAGEGSGTLNVVLTRLADYYERRDELKRKVRRAIAYPAFVVGFVILVLVVMMVFVIPRFVEIFSSFGTQLPAFTRGFMKVYDIITGGFLYIAGCIAGLVLLVVAYSKTATGHSHFSRLVLRLPLFGKLFRYAFLATYGRTTATLLSAGVSVLESMDITRDMTRNDVIRRVLDRVKDNIAQGIGIAVSMMGNRIFPALVVKMVQVGEDSGSLPAVLDRSSTYYERKMDATIATMITILEPAMIVIVGGIVLVVLIALYLPIFTMSDVKGA